jgi:hypothetical protein
MNLAPNGKKSNLTPEQYKLVRTPAFKKWFGDWINSPETASKVMDEETKEPLVVYHGTNEQFNVFNKKGKGNRVLGYFFTTDKDFSENYGESKLYFLNIKNIKNFNSEKFDSLNTRQNAENNYWQLEKDKLLEGMYNGVLINRNYFFAGVNFVRKDYVAFESNQIKLADGTNTTFDGSNPDIRYKQGANIKNKKMEKETYCVVVVQFDNGVKRTTEVMPKNFAIDWAEKYCSKDSCEIFECTPEGKVLNSLQAVTMQKGGGVKKQEVYIEYLNKDKGFKKDKRYFDDYQQAVTWAKANFENFNPDMIKYVMEFGGGVEPIKNAEGKYALYPENPTQKSLGLLMQYGGIADKVEKTQVLEHKITEPETAPKKRAVKTKKAYIAKKVGKVMKEFKAKKLRTPQGKTVTNPKQAIAIGLSEGRAGWKHKRKK